MEKMVGISIVHGEVEMANDEGGRTGMDEEEGKSDLLGDSMVIGNQRFLGDREDSELLTSRRV